MATTAKARKNPVLDRGFNVTVEQSIGRVRFSDTGDHSPVECAFLLIAQHQETWSTDLSIYDQGRELTDAEVDRIHHAMMTEVTDPRD